MFYLKRLCDAKEKRLCADAFVFGQDALFCHQRYLSKKTVVSRRCHQMVIVIIYAIISFPVSINGWRNRGGNIWSSNLRITRVIRNWYWKKMIFDSPELALNTIPAKASFGLQYKVQVI
jgi:hypothetical protein